MKHVIRNLPQWISTHQNQLLVCARLGSVVLLAVCVAAQAWPSALGILVIAVYLHKVLHPSG